MRIRHLLDVARSQGIRWTLFRLLYAVQRRSGWKARQSPVRPWRGSRRLNVLVAPGTPTDPVDYLAWRRQECAWRFFEGVAHARNLGPAYDAEDAVQRVRDSESGRWTYFERSVQPDSFPPNWFADSDSGVQLPTDAHWSRLSVPDGVDIKMIWEPSRFAIVYPLARAWAATQDDEYTEMFWTLFDDWYSRNPPMAGPNWMCGQESSLRVLAWSFALHAFLHSDRTSADRVACLVEAIAAHGDRICTNLAYAWSQKNNHGISEATALWTIGLLFPELTRASEWRAAGRRLLSAEADRQFYPDGWYIQHSFNYQRLAVDLLVWSCQLGALNNEPLDGGIRERLAAATALLVSVQDPETGRLPNYGPNDGALLHRLSSCGLRDFRPSLGAAHYLTTGTRLYGEGPWDEHAAWLFGPRFHTADRVAPERSSGVRPDGGYVILRGERTHGALRCARYRDRPTQADQLHLDLWWRGRNIAADAGTFSYNAAPPWRNGLAATSVHNTVTLGNTDQMTRVRRFLWAGWAQGRSTRETLGGRLEFFQGEHDGYHRIGATHRRGVIRVGEVMWCVVDDITGPEDEARLHWLLSDYVDYELGSAEAAVTLETTVGSVVFRGICSEPSSWSATVAGRSVRPGGAEEEVQHGWVASYGRREPALSVAIRARSAPSLRFVSVFALGAATGVEIDPGRVAFHGRDIAAEVLLQAPGSPTLLASAELRDENRHLCLTPERRP